MKEHEMHAGARRRPGPKPRGQFEDKRFTLTTRITESTRKRLEGAAENSGRSLSQEIELRLEQSFRDDEAWGGARTKALLQFLARKTQLHGHWRDDDWLDTNDRFGEVLHEWYQHLEHLRLTLRDRDIERERLDIQEISKLLARASPSEAAALRRAAFKIAGYAPLNHDERVEWELLGSTSAYGEDEPERQQ
jgi:hypothetical protein